MQLGTRWPVGGDVPPRVPEAVVAAIREVEAELAEVDTAQWRWTLTWLEGRPVVELDDGTRLRVAHDGSVIRDQLD
ncbi:hypothetical protein [Homoserinibacter sp. GY 40078]|uniref:hypothetical protein n=1 Tax=Homoserinibacter sp. GY 40078 TaxID=2603275 RepID=UPI0011C72A82|nr:hypothetical protein [Homoserinibacter sp. GY 40078]TXK19711.1 hypothetical protein FVQ89_07550 [Homoserinibacter sp. GY 40078]